MAKDERKGTKEGEGETKEGDCVVKWTKAGKDTGMTDWSLEGRVDALSCLPCRVCQDCA